MIVVRVLVYKTTESRYKDMKQNNAVCSCRPMILANGWIKEWFTFYFPWRSSNDRP